MSPRSKKSKANKNKHVQPKTTTQERNEKWQWITAAKALNGNQNPNAVAEKQRLDNLLLTAPSIELDELEQVEYLIQINYEGGYAVIASKEPLRTEMLDLIKANNKCPVQLSYRKLPLLIIQRVGCSQYNEEDDDDEEENEEEEEDEEEWEDEEEEEEQPYGGEEDKGHEGEKNFDEKLLFEDGYLLLTLCFK